MNNNEAKTLVNNELNQIQYVLSGENDINGKKAFVFTATTLGIISLPILVKHPVPTTLTIVAMSAGARKIIDKLHNYTKEEKLQMRREYYGRKVLLGYKRT